MTHLRDQLSKTFSSAGLRRGDIVFLHNDLSPIIKSGKFDWWGDAAELLKNSFFDVVGPEGTLVVPTFNFDFAKGKDFNVKKTPSKMGLFTNFILYSKDSSRSLHPMFSCAAIGAKAEQICANVSKYSFGKDSVFDRLISENAKIAIFGMDHDPTFGIGSFCHYIEFVAKVPYRQDKQFEGWVDSLNGRVKVTCSHYVRPHGLGVPQDFSRLNDDLDSASKLTRVKLFEKHSLVVTNARDALLVGKTSLVRTPELFMVSTNQKHA